MKGQEFLAQLLVREAKKVTFFLTRHWPRILKRGDFHCHPGKCENPFKTLQVSFKNTGLASTRINNCWFLTPRHKISLLWLGVELSCHLKRNHSNKILILNSVNRWCNIPQWYGKQLLSWHLPTVWSMLGEVNQICVTVCELFTIQFFASISMCYPKFCS